MAERSERMPPLPKVAPWLVIPYGKGMKNQAFYNLCERRSCRKLIPELSGKSIFQKPCHQGWLVILCNNKNVGYTKNRIFGDCFLWNPSTLEKPIKLPNILSSGYIHDDDYFLVDCVLSSPPNTATASSVFLLFMRWDNMRDYVFLFCRPGDKQWRCHKFTREKHSMGDNYILSLNYLQGNLYAMSSSYVSHFKVEIDGDLSVTPFETYNFPSTGKSYTSGRLIYAQTRDELYRIDLLKTDGCHQEVISIEIRKLDFSLLEWKEVNSLGDTVLFFGKNTTACCSAAELGLTSGCLYYTLPNDQSLYRYELQGTGTIILPCPELPTPCFSSNWIMMDATFRVSDGQLERSKFVLDKREEDYIMNLAVKTNKENQGEAYNSGDVKQQTHWSILNEDDIHQIASYLNPVDYKLFRSVCKANQLNLSVAKHISKTCVSPWLVFSNSNDRTVYKFVDPMYNNENYSMKRPLLRGATIRYQKGGWLLMSEGARRIFFHNPFTKETIQLPDLPEYCKLYNISFCSLPTCFDCVVFSITECNNGKGGIGVYVIARGQKSWRYQEFDNIDTHEYYMPLLNSPVLHKGILYCADYNGLLGAFSLEDGITWSYKVLEKPHQAFSRAYPAFLVECGGDVLLVKLGRIGEFLGILKMDFSKMKWVRVKTLGKHTLFISYTSCVSRIAPCSGMENKIYFPRLSLHDQGVLFYSIDTRSYHFLGNQHSSTDFSDTKGWSSWSWIEPNWSRSTDQELNWSTILS